MPANDTGFDRFLDRVRSVFSGDLAEIDRYAAHVEDLAHELAGEPDPGPVGSSKHPTLTRLKRAMLAQERALERVRNLAGDTAAESTKGVPDGAAATPAPTPAPVQIADDVFDRAMRLRDRVESLAERPDDIKDLPRVLGWLDRELLGLLEDLGASVIDDEGEVDPGRHEVVDVRRAGPDDPVDHIAATVQVGYATDDHLLRTQKVIAFVQEPSSW